MLEQLNDAIPITAVPGLLPPKGGKRVHVSTIWRWAQRGCRGTYVLRSDLERFLAAINDQTLATGGTPVAGSRSAKVASELDALKI
jgi:hypothetical protein